MSLTRVPYDHIRVITGLDVAQPMSEAGGSSWYSGDTLNGLICGEAIQVGLHGLVQEVLRVQNGMVALQMTRIGQSRTFLINDASFHLHHDFETGIMEYTGSEL